MIPFPEMTTDEFYDRLDELEEYYDTHDDIKAGVFLKNKKYWYLWYGTIQYGYVDYDTVGAMRDGSCKNRITFLDSTVHMKCFSSIRTVPRGAISDNKKEILKIYARHLKDERLGSAVRSKQLKKLSEIFPELVL